MGRGLAGCAARQHPDLTPPTRSAAVDSDHGADSAARTVLLILLAIDGVISAICAALFLPSYLGSMPFPVSALIAGVVNTALVWAALEWAPSPRLAGLPLWTWLLTVAGLTFGGPGDDVVFGSHGASGWGLPVLIAFGALPPGWLLWRRGNRPAATRG